MEYLALLFMKMNAKISIWKIFLTNGRACKYDNQSWSSTKLWILLIISLTFYARCSVPEQSSLYLTILLSSHITFLLPHSIRALVSAMKQFRYSNQEHWCHTSKFEFQLLCLLLRLPWKTSMLEYNPSFF